MLFAPQAISLRLGTRLLKTFLAMLDILNGGPVCLCSWRRRCGTSASRRAARAARCWGTSSLRYGWAALQRPSPSSPAWRSLWRLHPRPSRSRRCNRLCSSLSSWADAPNIEASSSYSFKQVLDRVAIIGTGGQLGRGKPRVGRGKRCCRTTATVRSFTLMRVHTKCSKFKVIIPCSQAHGTCSRHVPQEIVSCSQAQSLAS